MKRRGGGGGNILPVTSADATAANGKTNVKRSVGGGRRRRRRRKQQSFFRSPGFWLTSITLTTLVVVYVVTSGGKGNRTRSIIDSAEQIKAKMKMQKKNKRYAEEAKRSGDRDRYPRRPAHKRSDRAPRDQRAREELRDDKKRTAADNAEKTGDAYASPDQYRTAHMLDKNRFDEQKHDRMTDKDRIHVDEAEVDVADPLMDQKQRLEDETKPDAPTSQLSQFPSLQYSLRQANLVALYFGAAWCPVCTPVTKLLTETFETTDVLLDPSNDLGDEKKNEEDEEQKEKSPLSIVYVSSDKNELEMVKNGSTLWQRVPFASEERTLLKRHFHTCAEREMQQLDVDRRHEIPTIIVIDAATQGILTTDGVNDLKEYGEKALEHWQELQGVVEGLQDKYVSEE